jgi:hypothetical protein
MICRNVAARRTFTGSPIKAASAAFSVGTISYPNE